MSLEQAANRETIDARQLDVKDDQVRDPFFGQVQASGTVHRNQDVISFSAQSAQVVHFDTESSRDARAWLLGTTCKSPTEVCVTWALPVSDDFHARFSAIGRQYRYIILNRQVRPALLHERVSCEFRPLDEARMAEAARCLVGLHDFSSFRAQGCQAKNPQRDVYTLEIHRHGEFIYLDIAANAFLHHMVRNIAGTLMAVGRGDQPVVWVQNVLEAPRDRNIAGITASAAGLYLVQVRYPEHFAVPQTVRLPGFG